MASRLQRAQAGVKAIEFLADPTAGRNCVSELRIRTRCLHRDRSTLAKYPRLTFHVKLARPPICKIASCAARDIDLESLGAASPD